MTATPINWPCLSHRGGDAMRPGHKIFMAVAVFAFLLAGLPLRAGVLWKADMNISVGDDSNRLILGQAQDATDGFENIYESRVLFGGNLASYFHYPEWGQETPYFWTDIKDSTLPKEWVFYVYSQYVGKDITIKWTLNAPATLKVYLTDNALGTVVDMAESSSYSYTNTSTSARKFIVHASGEIPAQ